MSSHMVPNDPRYQQIIKGVLPFVFTLLGVASGYEVAQKVTQQPLLQTLIVIGTSLLAYGVSFAGKVWQRWEGKLIDKTAEWGPSFLKNIFGGYYRRYLHYLSHVHRVAEFNGLFQRPAYRRDIDLIFVEPDIAPIPPHLASSHLFKRIQIAGAKSHTIWHYLSDKDMTSDPLILLGAAGSGKTTVLKYIAYTLSQERLYSPLWYRHRLPYSFPVLLPIREQLPLIKEKPESTLAELIQEHVKKNKRTLVLPLQWIEQKLQQGHGLIMLDGLDEAPNERERKLVLEWVRGQMHTYDNTRFLLTARPYGYINTPIDGVNTLQIQPFTQTQIKSFIEQWYLIDEQMQSGKKNDAAARTRASEGAGNLLARLYQKPALLALAANPLLLTMIATLYSTGGTIPNKRSDLYHEIFLVLLYKRREVIGLPAKLNVQQKLEVLQPLASYMMQNRLQEIDHERISQVITPHLSRISTEVTADEFLKDIEQNSALLIEMADTWSFAHKTLQEYLAATHIKEKRRENILLKQLHDPWWHEAIAFYSAQADATKILEACLMEADTSVQMLDLALECNEQKLKADAAVTRRIDALLQAGVEDTNPGKRSVVAEALLKRRLENMVYLHDEVYTDTSMISCAEYQLFLDEQNAQGKYYHPWHWRSASFKPGQGREPILGVQPRDIQAFCGWLNARESGGWRYRMPSPYEAGQIMDHLDEATRSRSDSGFWIAKGEIYGLTWFGNVVPEYTNLEELLLDQLLLDRAKIRAYDRVRADDRKELIDDTLELEQLLDKAFAPDVNPLLVQGITVYPFHLDEHQSDPHTEHYLYPGTGIGRLVTLTMMIPDYLERLRARKVPFYVKDEENLLWIIRYLSQLWARAASHVLNRAKQFNTSLTEIQLGDVLQSPLQVLYIVLKGSRRPRQSTQEVSWLEQIFVSHRRIAIDFALLELRTRGKLPPWEGMVLVKERTRSFDRSQI